MLVPGFSSMPFSQLRVSSLRLIASLRSIGLKPTIPLIKQVEFVFQTRRDGALQKTPIFSAKRSFGSFAHKYLDPTNDLAFKRIFGEEKRKPITIDFLNAVFHLVGMDQIIDLEFLKLTQTPEIDARKESIVDVLVRDQSGTKYIIEIQVAKVEGFEKRAQYYAAKTYCAHFARGKKYQDLKKVVFLAITDYVVFPNKEGYKSDHVILDNRTYEHDLKDFSFTFVELPKFNKNLDELKSIEEQWYYFLKHADEGENIKKTLSQHPEIKEAYDVLDQSSWTEEELLQYEKNITNVADMWAMIDAAKAEGKAEGKAAGIVAGVESVARRMLGRGVKNLNMISEITGIGLQRLDEIVKSKKEDH